ncbi:MAG: hypothetical protein ISP91_09760 [Pseudomonadales bacterium]|nr:hypothetical protein [Pseudomonadales bacterium]
MRPHPGYLIIAMLLTLWGCDQQQQETPRLLVDPVLLGTSVSDWQKTRMNQSVASTTMLVNQTNRFLDNPDEETRSNWQLAWNRAHEDFHHATLLMPTDSLLHVDVWPIEPGFLDALPEYPESGIISDLSLDITVASLQAQHMLTDRSESSLGFHVLEYYAFDRPLDDMLPGDNLRERRRTVIKRVSDHLLLEVLQLKNSLQESAIDALPQTTYPALVASLASRTDSISSALNFSTVHGEFSGRSAQVIAAQFSAIYDLLNGEVNINRYLASIDPEQTRVLNSTLSDALDLVPQQGQLDESDTSRMQLLAAAISHQLEDFDISD